MEIEIPEWPKRKLKKEKEETVIKKAKVSGKKYVNTVKKIVARQQTEPDYRCYACINFVPISNKKLKTKKYVAAITVSPPVPLSADVEPPKAPSPDAVSALTAANGFTNASNVQNPDWMPDVEDSVQRDEMKRSRIGRTRGVIPLGHHAKGMFAEVCWWSQKISQHEDKGTEDEDEGHTERDMPLNILSSVSSNGDGKNTLIC
ncbi:hypothetical protein FQA39_LY08150 [Lamprigera yunnana]|nr:hypothetical protein FQA39_LY08150 [Lamprigera yunnana]